MTHTENDVHSKLNPTVLQDIIRPGSLLELQSAVSEAARNNASVCVAGERHSMGGQQFASEGVLVDLCALCGVLHLDAVAGIIEVEAGITWPELLQYLEENACQWTIAQKQTGADKLSLGGAIGSNIHGRGLKMKPFIQDVESFVIVAARGETKECSRNQNQELFSLVIGGYGLFGIVYSLRLRLVPRCRLRRTVELIKAADLIAAFECRATEGYLYGDYQFAIDDAADNFLREGVFSCYAPVEPETPEPLGERRQLSVDDWKELLLLAHTDKSEAFSRYADHYLASSGQLYWSDSFQLSTYIKDYHLALDAALKSEHQSTEIITEIYVPRRAFAAFIESARERLRESRADVIYGTVRLIEKDDESFLAWAREDYACTIFNLHTEHTPAGLAQSGQAFLGLIDLAIQFGGSYYLTYHRFATSEQLERCHPRFAEFLRLKKEYDPQEIFQSDWYRHYHNLFGG